MGPPRCNIQSSQGRLGGTRTASGPLTAFSAPQLLGLCYVMTQAV